MDPNEEINKLKADNAKLTEQLKLKDDNDKLVQKELENLREEVNKNKQQTKPISIYQQIKEDLTTL